MTPPVWRPGIPGRDRTRRGRYPADLAGWLRDGRLISREQIIEGGVRAFPDALLRLFAGENLGKLIVAVAPARDP